VLRSFLQYRKRSSVIQVEKIFVFNIASSTLIRSKFGRGSLVNFSIGDDVWRVGSWEFMEVESLLVLLYGSESQFSRNLWKFYPLLVMSSEHVDMS